MKKFIVSLLSLIIFTGCTIASPLTTTREWLETMKNGKYEEAESYLTNVNKELFIDEYKNESGKVVDYEVQNAIPLSKEELDNYGVSEGNTVYFKVVFENGKTINMKIYAIKKEGVWKIMIPSK